MDDKKEYFITKNNFNAEEALDIIEDFIHSVKTKNKEKEEWVSVRDKLPNEGSMVICAIADDIGDNVYYYTYPGWYSGYDYKFIIDDEYNYDVEYWMSLPNYPEWGKKANK